MKLVEGELGPIIAEHEHRNKCENRIKNFWLNVGRIKSSDVDAAKAAVRERLARLPVGSPNHAFEAAEETALAPFYDANERHKMVQHARSVAEGSRFAKPGEADEFEQQLQAALDSMPRGTTVGELTAIAEDATKRFADKMEARKRKSDLVERGMTLVSPYISRLDKKHDLGDYWLIDWPQRIRPVLEAELSGKETADDVEHFVKRWVRRELGI